MNDEDDDDDDDNHDDENALQTDTADWTWFLDIKDR